MYNAPILKKAIEILRLISRENRPLGVTEISKPLAISKSTAYGILKAFSDEGLVRKDSSTKKYTIGKELMRLAKMIFKGQDIITIARPFMEALSEAVDESVFLGIKEYDAVKVIDVVEARKSFKISSPIGTKLPITAGAIGKLFLSTMKDREISLFLKEKGLPKYTENSITEIGAFVKEIKATRESGYSTDFEEYLIGVNAIATFIYQDKNPIGAIWLVGFSNSLTVNVVEDLISRLKDASKQISAKLSFNSDTDSE